MYVDGSLLARALLAPSLIVVATLAGRRWGSNVAGLIAGLPLTSGPISAIIAYQHGVAFAASAALGTLAGLNSVIAFVWTYGWSASRGASPLASILASLAAYSVLTALIVATPHRTVTSAIVFLFAFLSLAVFTYPKVAGAVANNSRRAWDLPVRMVCASILVVTLTAGAAALGPTVTGILSPFPVFAAILGTCTHLQEGQLAAAMFQRGVLFSTFGFAAFFVVVVAGPQHSLGLLYLASAGAAFATSIVVWLARRLHG